MPLEQLDNGVKILADEMQVAVHLPNGRAMKISKETYFQSLPIEGTGNQLPNLCFATRLQMLINYTDRIVLGIHLHNLNPVQMYCLERN